MVDHLHVAVQQRKGKCVDRHAVPRHEQHLLERVCRPDVLRTRLGEPGVAAPSAVGRGSDRPGRCVRLPKLVTQTSKAGGTSAGDICGIPSCNLNELPRTLDGLFLNRLPIRASGCPAGSEKRRSSSGFAASPHLQDPCGGLLLEPLSRIAGIHAAAFGEFAGRKRPVLGQHAIEAKAVPQVDREHVPSCPGPTRRDAPRTCREPDPCWSSHSPGGGRRDHGHAPDKAVATWSD